MKMVLPPLLVLVCSTVELTKADLATPAAVFPLNAQFGTKDISSNNVPPGNPVGVQLAEGPDGKPGGSYYFTGASNSYIEFPSSSKLDARFSITLLAMVYPESEDGPLLDYKASNWRVHWWLVSGNLFWRMSNRATFALSNAVKTHSKLDTSKWSYIGATYDYSSGLARVWVDGQKVRKLKAGTMEIATQFPARMGAKAGDTRYFRGRISCFQVYNKALTQDEITAFKSRCSRIKPFSLCFDHGVIDDPTRSVKFITKDSPTSDYGALSDSTWYRFTGDPGTQLATTCVPEGRCGTQATGWLNSPYPSQETGIAKADVCFNFGGDCCAHKETIYLRKCSNFYVFKFEKVKIAVTPKRRYCVETHTDATPSLVTAYVADVSSGLVGHVVYVESPVPNVITCTGYCTLHDQCMALNYSPLTNTCELSNSTRDRTPTKPRMGFQYYEASVLRAYYFP